MNKSITVFCIVLLSLVVCALSFGLYYVINNNYDFSNIKIFSYSNVKLLESKTFDEKNIIIENKVGDIKIEYSTDDKVYVEVYANYDLDYSIDEDDNTIKVATKREKAYALFRSSKLVVKLPKDTSKDLTINSEVGDIKVDSFINLKPYIKLATGDIEVKEVDTLEFDHSTGDIEVDTVKNLKGTNVTGDIKVGEADFVTLKTSTGDIRIEDINNQVEITKGTGDVRLDTVKITENSFIKGGTGDVRIKSITGCYIDSKSHIGDNDINNGDRKAELELSIDIKIGDVKVN